MQVTKSPMREQLPAANPKNKGKKNPQDVRAKTFNMPKDFREELRKLQQMQK